MSTDCPYVPLHEPRKSVSGRAMRDILAKRYAEALAKGVDAKAVLKTARLPPLAAQEPIPHRVWRAYAWSTTDHTCFLLLEKGRYGAFRVEHGIKRPLGFRDTRDAALKLFDP